MVVTLIVPLETIMVAQLQLLTKIQSQLYVLLLAQLVIIQILHYSHASFAAIHAQPALLQLLVIVVLPPATEFLLQVNVFLSLGSMTTPQVMLFLVQAHAQLVLQLLLALHVLLVIIYPAQLALFVRQLLLSARLVHLQLSALHAKLDI